MSSKKFQINRRETPQSENCLEYFKLSFKNNKLYFILPVIISIVALFSVFGAQQAFSNVVIDQYVLKIVIEFDLEGTNETQVKNYITNTVYPKLRDKVIEKLQANFISWSLEKKLKVHQLVGDTYQVYPKMVFSGETTLTISQLKTGVDNLMGDLKTIVKDELALQGATNVKYLAFFFIFYI